MAIHIITASYRNRCWKYMNANWIQNTVSSSLQKLDGHNSELSPFVLLGLIYEIETKKIHCVSIPNSNFRAHFKEGGVRWEKQQLTTMITRAELTGLDWAVHRTKLQLTSWMGRKLAQKMPKNFIQTFATKSVHFLKEFESKSIEKHKVKTLKNVTFFNFDSWLVSTSIFNFDKKFCG